jgi:type II secretory pathway pseudopilin PulG
MRTKILKVFLSTALGTIVVLSIIGIVSLLGMRRLTLRHGDQLGSTAARQSQTAMEAQARKQLLTLARDRAALADEKFSAIQNQTRMTADIATQIYTHKDRYAPVFIDYLRPGQAGELIPHVATAAGVSIAQHRDEIYRAANIGDILRQVTVLDMDVEASYIGTESGFSIIIEKDAPFIENDYDARTRLWYQGARAKGDLFWTDIYADVSGKGASISCAIPFYDLSDGGKVFKGVAASEMLLSDTVNKIIDATRIGKTGYTFFLNEKGHMIISPGS